MSRHAHGRTCRQAREFELGKAIEAARLLSNWLEIAGEEREREVVRGLRVRLAKARSALDA